MSNYLKAEWYRTWKSKDLYVLLFLILGSISLAYFLPLIWGAGMDFKFLEFYPSFFLATMISTAPYMILCVVLITFQEDMKQKTIQRPVEMGLSREKVLTVKLGLQLFISVILIAVSLLCIAVEQKVFYPSLSVNMDTISSYFVGLLWTILFLIPFWGLANVLTMTIKGTIKVFIIYIILARLHRFFSLLTLMTGNSLFINISKYLPSSYIEEINRNFSMTPDVLEHITRIPQTSLSLPMMVGISLTVAVLVFAAGYGIFQRENL